MFQFGRREKTVGLRLEGGGVPSFIVVCSSLERVKNEETIIMKEQEKK